MILAELVGPLTLTALIVSCVTVLVIVGLLHRSLTVKFGTVTASVGDLQRATAAVDAKVERVDHAVNQREPGDNTISQDVRQMTETVGRVSGTVGRLSTELAMHGERLAEVGHLTRETYNYAHKNTHLLGNTLTPLVGQVAVLWEEGGHEPLPSARKGSDEPA